MKRRTKKVLSLLLAASMVFTMNTIAFGEEIVAEDVAADEVVTEEVVTDDVAEVAEEAAVEEAGEATLDEAELEDASLAGVDFYDDGLGYNKDGLASTVEYKSDGAKKNPVNSVVVMTNVDDPVSWNNFYATNLIETVLTSTDKDAEYLNNGEKMAVSKNNVVGQKGEIFIGTAIPGAQYRSIKVEDGVFLFVRYGTVIPAGAGTVAYTAEYVDGHSSYAGADKAPLWVGGNTDAALEDADNTSALVSRIDTLPTVVFDGRKIVLDKDNKYSSTKTQKESIRVAASLVKYEGGTLTELNGVEVGSIKIDTKTVKNASVEAATTQTKVGGKYINTNGDEKDVNAWIPQHKTMGTLPSFKLTVKVKGKDVKKYNKNIKSALDKEKFEFGIEQREVDVADPTAEKVAGGAFTTEFITRGVANWHQDAAKPDDNTNNDVLTTDADGNDWNIAKAAVPHAASSNGLTKDDKTGVQDVITKDYEAGGYVDSDKDDFTVDDLKISKFTVNTKGAKATITDTVQIWKDGNNTNTTADVAIKEKDNYSFEKGSLAGEDVYALTFKDGGNYVYNSSAADLGGFGFKYAFRKSPVEKSKQFREGIYVENNAGFVHSAE